MKLKLTILSLLCLGLFINSCSSDKEFKELSLAYVMSPGGTSHEAAMKFSEIISEKSKGKIKVRLYPNGILGNDRTLLEGLRLRSIDIIFTGPSIIGWNAPEYGVIEAPFVFRDYEHMEKVMRGSIGKDIEDIMYKKRKVHFLSFLHRGQRYLTTTNRIVKVPEDLSGLKLRVPELPTYIKSWKIFGANPTPLAYSDIFMALKQGVVDGQENPLEVVYTSHLYEIQNYVMKTEHLISFYLMCIGDYFYTKFSQQEQELIVDAVNEITVYHNELVKQFESKYIAELEASGVQFIDIDKSSFEELAIQKLPNMFKDIWKPNIYQRIRDIK